MLHENLMMKKLRLLVTKVCNRSCAGCCNKDFDLDSLPVITDFSNYEEIMITGGEPMLFASKILELIAEIRAQNSTCKIYLCTASTDVLENRAILSSIDGLQLSLHETNISEMTIFNFRQVILKDAREWRKISTRLSVFPEMENVIVIRPEVWDTIRFQNWIENCPLPNDEIFGQIQNLYV